MEEFSAPSPCAQNGAIAHALEGIFHRRDGQSKLMVGRIKRLIVGGDGCWGATEQKTHLSRRL
jgi:hypothetical protein